MKLHWEILEASKRSQLERIAAVVATTGFYLAGGTGLALLAGHRQSVDFDFFFESERLVLPGMERFKQVFQAERGYRIRLEEQGTLHLEIGQARISFLATPYPLLRRPVQSGLLRIAHPVDIGLMKLAAIVSRGSRRDFVDLACVLDRYASLEGLLKLAQRKYPQSRDFAMQAARALVYFTDAEREADPLRLEPRYRWGRVKAMIEAEVRKVLPGLIKARA